MPLSLILLAAIIDITIVDVFNFQNFSSRTLGAMENWEIFKFFAIAKSLQYLSPFDKLNACTKRKTEYFSFLKHPFRQIFTKTRTTLIKMTDHLKPTVVTAETPPSTATMTASEQQTGVITHINE